MQQEQKLLIELAMFLAIAFLLQSLRLLLPMIPGPVNIFFVGSLLNMVMALAIWRTQTRWAAMIGLLLPIGAFFQGQLPIAPMIPVVAIGNAVFTLAADAQLRPSRLSRAIPQSCHSFCRHAIHPLTLRLACSYGKVADFHDELASGRHRMPRHLFRQGSVASTA